MAPRKSFRKFKHKFKLKVGGGVTKSRQFEVTSKTTGGFLRSDNAVFRTNVLNEDMGLTSSIGPTEYITDGEEGLHSESASGTTLSSYERRKIREGNGWERIRERIKEINIIQQHLEASTVCVVCAEHNANPRKAVCRCQDCGWQQNFCIECATARHSNSNMFHVLEIWKDGTFVPLFSNNFTLEAPGHKFRTVAKYTKQIIFIDLKGRQHLKSVNFCRCQSEAETIVSMGFWPSTAEKPSTAFDMRLLTFLSILLLECHVSLDKLCAAIQLWQDPLLPLHVTNIYKILNNASFDEFRLFLYSQGIQNEQCILCPAPGENGTLIEIMDACFGFPRKKSAGKSICSPRFGNSIFADQADVDNFVEKHSKDVKKSENPCNQYKAGEIETSLRSKGRNEKLDEKAIFGRICRHGFPKGFVSLKHGERIAYAVYELKRMVEPYVNSENVELKCMYDIACILKRHLDRNSESYELGDMAKRIKFGIPLFHAYVHVAACQVLYSPRRAEGFGLTDGEGIERLWSYLRKFCHMTKEMTASRRTDILSEGLLHYARRVMRNQGKYLAQGLQKSKNLKEQSIIEQNKAVSELPADVEPVTIESLKKWKEEELSLVSAKKAVTKSIASWEQEYALLLWEHWQIRNTIASCETTIDDSHGTSEIILKSKRLEKKVRVLEMQNGISSRWKLNHPKFTAAMKESEAEKRKTVLQKLHSIAVERHLQLMLKERYSQGQKQAIRLARRAGQQTKRLKLEISKYNAKLSLLKDHVYLPLRAILFDEAKDPNSNLYQQNVNASSFRDKIPFSLKRRIIESADLQERCEEENSLLHAECERLLNYKLKILEKLQEKANELSDLEDSQSLGLRSVLLRQVLVIKNELLSDKTTFDKFELTLPDSVTAANCEYLSRIAFSSSPGYDTDSDIDCEELDIESTDEESDSELTFESS